MRRGNFLLPEDSQGYRERGDGKAEFRGRELKDHEHVGLASQATLEVACKHETVNLHDGALNFNTKVDA